MTDPLHGVTLEQILTELVAQYHSGSGAVLYQFIASVPASSVWKTETFNITVPTGATAVTVFHLIGANGILEIDNYSLILGATPPRPRTYSLEVSCRLLLMTGGLRNIMMHFRF